MLLESNCVMLEGWSFSRKLFFQYLGILKLALITCRRHLIQTPLLVPVYVLYQKAPSH